MRALAVVLGLSLLGVWLVWMIVSGAAVIERLRAARPDEAHQVARRWGLQVGLGFAGAGISAWGLGYALDVSAVRTPETAVGMALLIGTMFLGGGLACGGALAWILLMKTRGTR